MIEELLSGLRAASSPGVHLGMSAVNEAAYSFYVALGFRKLTRHGDVIYMGMKLRQIETSRFRSTAVPRCAGTGPDSGRPNADRLQIAAQNAWIAFADVPKAGHPCCKAKLPTQTKNRVHTIRIATIRLPRVGRVHRPRPTRAVPVPGAGGRVLP